MESRCNPDGIQIKFVERMNADGICATLTVQTQCQSVTPYEQDGQLSTTYRNLNTCLCLR